MEDTRRSPPRTLCHNILNHTRLRVLSDVSVSIDLHWPMSAFHKMNARLRAHHLTVQHRPFLILLQIYHLICRHLAAFPWSNRSPCKCDKHQVNQQINLDISMTRALIIYLPVPAKYVEWAPKVCLHRNGSPMPCHDWKGYNNPRILKNNR